ncbi:MAG: hypothetical protein N4A35_07105 [Flavobacteriales bacterium]|jgi:hypothetical protein|nr:hypothetical protein [Flavobacteriales bacterium]
MKKTLISLIILLLIVVSCKKKESRVQFGVFKVTNDTTATMNGVIGGRIESHFDKMIKYNPNIRTIILEDCPGSKNDNKNLRLSKKIYDEGINTMLRSSSVIASGAVDLFLAGKKRTFDNGAQLGVHSWGGRTGKTAQDFPRDHEEHKKYIDYYKYIGMTDQEAKDFYFFTIDSAPAESVHWMTQEELLLYKIAR